MYILENKEFLRLFHGRGKKNHQNTLEVTNVFI